MSATVTAMSRSRDRHARGFRGPLALPHEYTGRPVPLKRRPNRAEYFLQCVTQSLERISANDADVLLGIDVGVEDVPVDASLWDGHIPLAAALESDGVRPAQVVIFRRPLERRALDRADLRSLVHRTVVEQLSTLTGRSVQGLDPSLDEDW